MCVEHGAHGPIGREVRRTGSRTIQRPGREPIIMNPSDNLAMALAKHSTTEATCDVAGCDKVAERSINIKQASRSGLELKNPSARSVHLCKDHYKSYKKDTKQDRGLDQVYE